MIPKSNKQHLYGNLFKFVLKSKYDFAFSKYLHYILSLTISALNILNQEYFNIFTD
jgi:hypothetical protein